MGFNVFICEKFRWKKVTLPVSSEVQSYFRQPISVLDVWYAILRLAWVVAPRAFCLVVLLCVLLLPWQAMGTSTVLSEASKSLLCRKAGARGGLRQLLPECLKKDFNGERVLCFFLVCFLGAKVRKRLRGLATHSFWASLTWAIKSSLKARLVLACKIRLWLGSGQKERAFFFIVR